MEDVTVKDSQTNLLYCQMLLFKDRLLVTIVADIQKSMGLVLFWVKVFSRVCSFLPISIAWDRWYTYLGNKNILRECSEDRVLPKNIGKMYSFQSFWTFFYACLLSGVHYTSCTQCCPGLDCTGNFDILTVGALFVATLFTSKCTALQPQGKQSHRPSFHAGKSSWIPDNEITSL